MSEENQSNQVDNQEIDLIDLMCRFFNWCGKILKSVFYGILYFLIRNRYLYAVVFLLVIVLTIYKSVFSEKYYNCDMIVQTKSISATEAVKMINNWNYRQSLDSLLSGAVRNINGTYVLDLNKDGLGDEIEEYTAKIVTDTARLNRRMPNEFCVQAQIYSTDVPLEDVSKALIDYMSSDPWVINRNEFQNMRNKELLASFDKELSMLDSLQVTEYFLRDDRYRIEKNGGMMFVGEKNKYLYHKDILDLLEQKHKLESNVYLEPFRIVQDFSIPMEAANNPFNIFKHSLAMILSIATILIFFYDRRKSFKALIEKSKI